MNSTPGIGGRVVAITSASSSIGEATALLLASRGARIVLGARWLVVVALQNSTGDNFADWGPLLGGDLVPPSLMK